MVQRQSALAAQYQQGNAQKAQQPLPRAKGIHVSNVAKKNAIRTQVHSALSYSTMVNGTGTATAQWLMGQEMPRFVRRPYVHQPSRGN